uniref:Adenylosuccinate synthase n=1 Tax=Gongylonema pulchrum TaxID=637853 RepID=A0A183DMB4_9BILA
LDSFFQELTHNKITSLPGWEERILISDRAHLVCGIHMLVDDYSEDKLKINKIGTTKRGIGPTYSSKCFRNGLRVGDLVHDFSAFSKKYVHVLFEAPLFT